MDRVPLHGVVSLLDPAATERVREIWARLGREFGLSGVLVMPYPHFSYQIAQSYDRSAIESTLGALAKEVAPFTIRTNGLATFPGGWPVVYIAVEKDASLRSLHERLWHRCLPHAGSPIAYYQPDLWTPHITLAHGEERNSAPLPESVVSAVMERLGEEEYAWTVNIDNVTLVWDDGGIQKPARTFQLAGPR